MRYTLLRLLLILIVATTAASAERIEFRKVAEDISQQVETASKARSVITIRVSAFDRAPVDIAGQTYWRISTGRESVRLFEGEPELPRICRSLVIPDNAAMTVNILAAEYTDYENTPVAPSKGSFSRTINPDDVPYVLGPVYQTSAWYPEKVAELREPYILRDQRAVVLELNAFQYHPSTRTLRVYTSITVEVVADGPGVFNVLSDLPETRRPVPEFDLIYDRQFINLAEPQSLAAEYTPVAEAGDMLVVVYDSFYTAMEPFVAWKNQKGIRTTMVDYSSTGGDSATLKTYIQDFYDSTNLAWVLLVGDYAELPPLIASGGPSDPSFVKLAGNDDYPDAIIGRFSAESVAEVETQVARTIAYEKTPLNSSWLHKACGIGSDEEQTGHEGERDWEHVDNLRDDLLLFTYDQVDQIYDPGALTGDLSTALNEGRSLVNYCGHGSSYGWSTTGFAVAHIDSLSNTDKLPLIYSVGCRNGNFDNLTCFAEAWLRATHNGKPSGAVGAYMSSINQDWIPPMDAQDEAVDLLAAQTKTSFGGICFNSSCRMMDLNDAAGIKTFNTWHIFGDPSLQMRTDSARTLTVVHDSVALTGYLEFDCEVTGETGALCALYAGGTLYGAAYTGATGQANIPLESALPVASYVTLTVTAFNALPYIDSIYVESSAQPFVVFDSSVVEITAGNSNGLVDYGESVQLGVRLLNVGLADALAVGAVLRTSDPYITVTDSTHAWDTILADWGMRYEADAFGFDVAADIPDRHVIEFELEISGDYPDTAFDSFEIEAHAPVLAVVFVTVDDSIWGDDDGILDPDEYADLTVTLGNTGSGDAVGVTAVLAEDDPYLVLDDSTGTFPTIDSISGTGANTADFYALWADHECPLGYTSTLTLQVSTPNGLATDIDFELIVGDRGVFWSDDFSSDRGWAGLGGSAEWTIASPSGGGGDPALDYSTGIDNGVLGNDLSPAGTYEHDIDQTQWVVSPVIDCSNIYGTTFTFYRWLGVEGNSNDMALLEVHNGESWVRIYGNPLASVQETSWSRHQFDLATHADYNPALRIRFGLGSTDDALAFSGWNIDDLEFSGYGTVGTPGLSLGQTSLSDSLQPGDHSEQQLWLHNEGDGTLTVSFECDSSWLAFSTEQQVIPGGDSLALTVAANGQELGFGDHSTSLAFTSNDDLNPAGSIPVSLHFFTPDISIIDTVIEDSVHEWHQLTLPLTISNNGPGRLDYQIACRMFNGETANPDVVAAVEAVGFDQGFGTGELAVDGARDNPSPEFGVTGGGPDSFGHYWTDSDDPGGPIFDWQDISTTGTAVGLADDDWAGPIAIGFDFPFYDTVYSDLYIGSNGLLTFDAGSSEALNRSLPSTLFPSPLIAVWWDNLDPGNGGTVRYLHDVANNRFIVSFENVPASFVPTGTGSLTFQAILYPSGRIVLQYGEMDAGDLDLDRSTVGIQKSGAADALEILSNTPYMHDSLAVAISTDHWLYTVVPGVPVEPYGSASIDVTLDASELSGGTYLGELIVVSNDPDRPTWIIPVDFEVTVNCCQGPTGNVNCSPDNLVDITDIQVLVDNLFLTLTPLCCEAEADTEPDGIVDITDLQLLIDNQFLTLTPLVDCP
ncbi:MAG: hypothetical protein GY867_03075 [bacterium]|nr:hypothetical protein [bacterium]